MVGNYLNFFMPDLIIYKRLRNGFINAVSYMFIQTYRHTDWCVTCWGNL